MIHVFIHLSQTSYNAYQMAYLTSSLGCLKFSTPYSKSSISSFTPAHPMIFSSFSIIYVSVNGPSRRQSVSLWKLFYSFSSSCFLCLECHSSYTVTLLHGHGSLLISLASAQCHFFREAYLDRGIWRTVPCHPCMLFSIPYPLYLSMRN